MENREFSLTLRLRLPRVQLGKIARRLLPTPGNVIFTLVMIGLLVAAQSVGALPLGRPLAAPSATSTGAIAYQGRLADAAGNPLDNSVSMVFRLYDAPNGGTPLWEETWTGPNGVSVSDGLFNVMLGSLTPIPASLITSHSSLYLGITVGEDNEMAPRVQLGSVPFAVQALSVPDDSVSTAKIADGAVTQAKVSADVRVVPPDGGVTTAKIADRAITENKLAAPISSQYVEKCFTYHNLYCPNPVTGFTRVSVGSSILWTGTFSFSAFPNGMISTIGRVHLADDTHDIGDVPLAVWEEGSGIARFWALLPAAYFNTTNSRLRVMLVGH